MSLSPGGTPASTSQAPGAMDPSGVIMLRVRRGAGWFLTIGLLSGVNSLLQIFDAKIRFIFGLGITQVRWAKTGSQGAFLGGMIAYALDGVLLLYFSMWLDAAVHAYALWMIWQGYSASRELAQMQQAAQPGLSQPRLP